MDDRDAEILDDGYRTGTSNEHLPASTESGSEDEDAGARPSQTLFAGSYRQDLSAAMTNISGTMNVPDDASSGSKPDF